MTEKKINELKKLMSFGFLIIDSKKNNKYINKFMETQPFNNLVPLMARLAVAYDLEHDENALSDMFNDSQTTKILEEAYSEYIEFDKQYEKRNDG